MCWKRIRHESNIFEQTNNHKYGTQPRTTLTQTSHHNICYAIWMKRPWWWPIGEADLRIRPRYSSLQRLRKRMRRRMRRRLQGYTTCTRYSVGADEIRAICVRNFICEFNTQKQSEIVKCQQKWGICSFLTLVGGFLNKVGHETLQMCFSHEMAIEYQHHWL